MKIAHGPSTGKIRGLRSPHRRGPPTFRPRPASEQAIDIGFPRYRLLLFNTTRASVSADVYVYASRL
ncbi:MAG: hypothetical protein LC796_07585 [Acidobacteria bacterium]|nr:hypothetical protein [Acidobacteriota bacterium]